MESQIEPNPIAATINNCPFCGHEPEETRANDLSYYYVGCANEDCTVQPETGLWDTAEKARVAWKWSQVDTSQNCPATWDQPNNPAQPIPAEQPEMGTEDLEIARCPWCAVPVSKPSPTDDREICHKICEFCGPHLKAKAEDLLESKPSPEIEELIEAARAWGYWSALRESSQETIDYWKARVDALKLELLDHMEGKVSEK